jgi:acyl-coenzyme A synthetase/AMP-(fatty) acid ligase
LGIIFKKREFKIVGRTSDSVNIGGVTVNLIDLDKIVQSCSFVSDGFSFVIENNEGIDELHLIACFCEGEDIEVSSNKILKIISKYTTPGARPKSVFVSGTIPRTSTGKPMRNKVLSILQN